jgi:hypothetical protein
VAFATRPGGKAREIVGIDQSVLDLFSSRRRAITAKTAGLVKQFEEQFGRAPTSLELDRLQRQATFATRQAKSHDGETVAERLERWDSQLRTEVRGALAQVADTALRQGRARGNGPATAWSERAVIETALAEVQEAKAAWTAPDLTRAISNALPDNLGPLSPAQVGVLLDGLTDRALELAVRLDAERPDDALLPDDLRLANGNSAYQVPRTEHLSKGGMSVSRRAGRRLRINSRGGGSFRLGRGLSWAVRPAPIPPRPALVGRATSGPGACPCQLIGLPGPSRYISLQVRERGQPEGDEQSFYAPGRARHRAGGPLMHPDVAPAGSTQAVTDRRLGCYHERRAAEVTTGGSATDVTARGSATTPGENGDAGGRRMFDFCEDRRSHERSSFDMGWRKAFAGRVTPKTPRPM